MNMTKLASELLAIVKAAAPLVGMAEEVAAAEALVEAVSGAVETVGDALSSDDQAALQAGLAELADKVNAHADRTADSLG